MAFFSPIARAALMAAATMIGAAAAADDLDVLKGATVRVVIAAGPGDSTDIESRLFFKYLQVVLPQTTFRIQDDGGTTAGAAAMLELVNATGRVITLAAAGQTILFRPLMTPETSPFDLSKMKWIGSVTRINRLLAMRKGLGGTTIETLRTLGRQPVAGGGSASGASAIEPLLINAITGLRLKVVTGMGEAERQALIVAGKVDVRGGSLIELQPLFDSGEMLPVLRFTGKSVNPTLDAVPTVADAARPGISRDLALLIETLYKVGGNMIAAAPSTDPAAVEALRRAFKTAVADPAFIEAATKNHTDVSPTDGVELTELIDQIVGPSSRLGAITRAAFECGKRISDTGATDCN